MLPRKRAAAGVDDQELKKPRDIDCLVSSSSSNNNSNDRSGGDLLHLAGMNGGQNDIVEDLHSRQLAVYGRETMRGLFVSSVLISGMNGLDYFFNAGAVC